VDGADAGERVGKTVGSLEVADRPVDGLGQRGARPLAADQCPHGFTGLGEDAHQLPADVSGCARDEDHRVRNLFTMARPRLVGINHVALEVGDLEEALAFYGSIFEIGPVDRESGMVFIDMGDQFLALSEGDHGPADRSRHFGLVVDDKPAVRAALERAGVEVSAGPRLNFRDPWGNFVQVVDYRDIQFTKAPEILEGMGLAELDKRPEALAELRDKGLA
jgi:lactoylglutathione lyase